MKQFVSIGESTWMIPMTWSLSSTAARTWRERMPWKRIESPAPKRGSTIASEVRIETRSFMHRSAIVLDTVMRPSPPPGLRCFTTIGTSRAPWVSSSQHQEAAVGRHVLEDDVHDLLEDLLDRPDRDERLRDLGEDLEDPVGLLDLLDVDRRRPSSRRPAPGAGAPR